MVVQETFCTSHSWNSLGLSLSEPITSIAFWYDWNNCLIFSLCSSFVKCATLLYLILLSDFWCCYSVAIAFSPVSLCPKLRTKEMKIFLNLLTWKSTIPYSTLQVSLRSMQYFVCAHQAWLKIDPAIKVYLACFCCKGFFMNFSSRLMI